MLYTSLISGGILVVIGILVYYFKFSFGFGNRPGQKVDKKGLSEFIGKNLIIAGLAIAIIDNVIYFFTKQYIFYVSLVVVFFLSFRISFGMNKYIGETHAPGKKADPKRIARKMKAGKIPESMKHNKKKQKRK
ncbi:hypothetical protein LPY66_19370 [Dehalobacter sp. DCM]|uniref:hypothetical protein n=1 Tax=Dehalobacter sp. DCM TaxID=2907827 RepID=UPI003081E3FB|nr:hypothetical protein LPY66_19370 [Dehalobacter sp. DCM]